MRLAVWTIGPLNADRFLRANTRLDDGEQRNGAGAASLKAEGIFPGDSVKSPSPLLLKLLLFPLTRRILLGNLDDAPGVVGSTLSDECGDLAGGRAVGVDADPTLFDEIDDAFEWVWAWWMLRMEDIEDEVDLRPRKPVEERR